MKNKLFLIILILLTTFLKAQNIYILDFKLFDKTYRPIQLELAYVYAEQSELSWSLSDKNGNIEFILNPTNQNTDSIYFIFGNGDIRFWDKLYLKDIHLLKENNTAHYVVVLQKLETYSKQEFEEYRIKHQLLPDRVQGHY